MQIRIGQERERGVGLQGLRLTALLPRFESIGLLIVGQFRKAHSQICTQFKALLRKTAMSISKPLLRKTVLNIKQRALAIYDTEGENIQVD